MIDVTIMVINYKQDYYIRRAIQSAEDQCKPKAPYLRNYWRYMPNFVVKRYDDLQGIGSSAARNQAMKMVATPYCIILDADDMLPSHFLWYLWCELEEAKRDVRPFTTKHFVGPSVQFFEGIRMDRLFYDCPVEYNGSTFETYCPCATISALFSMKGYHEIGGFDENLKALTDWDFFIRLHRAGYSYLHCSDTFILRRGDVPGSITQTGMSSEEKSKAILKAFNDKHGTKLTQYPQGYVIPSR